ncbi:DUF4871 domain-containing protein [Risungbinella massiliensis]|uniref:DUF4871 domain-containing protein n=1 Tax=Risungbinella massiliensis TaxID=1329796 RepID=UPI0005CB9AD8|nr:DUF4871 domain-containing protein [Risungbinella massiliensis]
MKKSLIIVSTLFILVTGCSTETAISEEKNTNPKMTNSLTPDAPPPFFQLSDIQNVLWQESPIFTYEGIELRGTPDKIGILSTPWKAGKPNKYMWHFFGDHLPSGTLTVVAVHKESNQVSKALIQADSLEQVWSTYPLPESTGNHRDLPASMMLPKKGMWVLNAYIEEKLYEQVIVKVE